MPDAPKLPPLPSHPEPHTYRWTDAELRVIAAYGAECRRLALEQMALACEAKAAERAATGLPREYSAWRAAAQVAREIAG